MLILTNQHRSKTILADRNSASVLPWENTFPKFSCLLSLLRFLRARFWHPHSSRMRDTAMSSIFTIAWNNRDPRAQQIWGQGQSWWQDYRILGENAWPDSGGLKGLWWKDTNMEGSRAFLRAGTRPDRGLWDMLQKGQIQGLRREEGPMAHLGICGQ